MTAIAVIAKAPVAGRSKTRLTPPCTPEQAAALASAALADTLAAVAATPGARRVLVLDGAPGPWLRPGFEVLAQRGAGLAERLAAAFADIGEPALVVGMDTPQLTPRDAPPRAGSARRRRRRARRGLRRRVLGDRPARRRRRGVRRRPDERAARPARSSARACTRSGWRPASCPGCATSTTSPTRAPSPRWRRARASPARSPRCGPVARSSRHDALRPPTSTASRSPTTRRPKLRARRPDGTAMALALHRWLGPLTAADEAVLDRTRGPVLDVGCGPGRHVLALARRGRLALGVDVAPAAVRVARLRGAPRHRGLGLRPHPRRRHLGQRAAARRQHRHRRRRRSRCSRGCASCCGPTATCSSSSPPAGVARHQRAHPPRARRAAQPLVRLGLRRRRRDRRPGARRGLRGRRALAGRAALVRAPRRRALTAASPLATGRRRRARTAYSSAETANIAPQSSSQRPR